jgi:hypothetical protein
MHPTSIDAGTLARTSMPQPGVLGADKTALRADVEQAKRALAMDIGQLVLDITGIIDPTPISDGANFLISLARRNWVDAVASAVSIVPYIGDLAKTAKLPRYIRSVRKAIEIARFDFRWARALRELFAKLKQVLDECSKLAADLLPDAAQRQLKALKDEIDNFLSMKGGTTGKSSGSGKKTGGQSSDTTKSHSKRNRPEPSEKLDKNPEKDYGPGKDDGPKTTHHNKKQTLSRLGGKLPPEGGRGFKTTGKQRPKWGDAPETGGLKGHTAKHGGVDGVPSDMNKYYDQAVGNMNNGHKFKYQHAGQTKNAYVTDLGGGKYLFTGASKNNKTIFTHMAVKERYLKNIGITLKN